VLSGLGNLGNLLKDKNGDLLADSKNILTGGSTNHGYWMYVGSVMLGRWTITCSGAARHCF
jgi:hypothetical protein